MNLKETAQLVSKMRALFPNSYVKATPAELQKIVAAWTEIFSEVEADKVFRALKEFTLDNNSPFAPSPGQLNKIIKKHDEVNDYRRAFEDYKKYLKTEERELLEG